MDPHFMNKKINTFSAVWNEYAEKHIKSKMNHYTEIYFHLPLKSATDSSLRYNFVHFPRFKLDFVSQLGPRLLDRMASNTTYTKTVLQNKQEADNNHTVDTEAKTPLGLLHIQFSAKPAIDPNRKMYLRGTVSTWWLQETLNFFFTDFKWFLHFFQCQGPITNSEKSQRWVFILIHPVYTARSQTHPLSVAYETLDYVCGLIHSTRGKYDYDPRLPCVWRAVADFDSRKKGTTQLWQAGINNSEFFKNEELINSQPASSGV